MRIWKTGEAVEITFTGRRVLLTPRARRLLLLDAATRWLLLLCAALVVAGWLRIVISVALRAGAP